jgi:hypothetical protein
MPLNIKHVFEDGSFREASYDYDVPVPVLVTFEDKVKHAKKIQAAEQLTFMHDVLLVAVYPRYKGYLYVMGIDIEKNKLDDPEYSTYLTAECNNNDNLFSVVLPYKDYTLGLPPEYNKGVSSIIFGSPGEKVYRPYDPDEHDRY